MDTPPFTDPIVQARRRPITSLNPYAMKAIQLGEEGKSYQAGVMHQWALELARAEQPESQPLTPIQGTSGAMAFLYGLWTALALIAVAAAVVEVL